nr:PKD domain-containing protein [Mangrovivirga halotolerans]
MGFSNDNVQYSRGFYSFQFQNQCFQSPSSTTERNPVISYNQPGTYPVTLTVTDSLGNKSSLTKEVTVVDTKAPIVTLDTDSVYCENSELQLSASSEGSVNSWYWQFGDGNSATGQTVSHQYVSDGSYPVMLQVTDSNTGCGNIAFDTISIFQEPVADFSNEQSVVCSNTDLYFENQSDLKGAQDYATYSWYLNESLVSNNIDYAERLDLPGTYSISLQTNIPGCYDSISKQIEVKAGPNPDFSFKEACENSFVSFNDLSTGSNIISRQWDFGNGTQSTAVSPEIFYEENGSYPVTLTLINDSNCQSSKIDTLKIYDIPNPDFSTSLACDNMPVKFRNMSTITGDQLNSWQWFVNGQEKSSLQNPEIEFETAGNYDVRLKVRSEFGCESSIVKSITINQSPSVDFIIENACSDNYVSFLYDEQNNSQAIKNWLWTIDGNEYLRKNVQKYFANTGEYSVKLNVIAENLCSEDTVRVFSIKQSPTAQFSVENPCEGEQTLFNSNTSNTVGYEWIINDNITLSGEKASWVFSRDGIHSLKHVVTATNGCTDTLSKEIDINKLPEVSFTVNNTEGGVPFLVDFTNESKFAETFLWDLEGDNKVLSNKFEPTYLYEFRGDYTVELTGFSKDSCSSSSVLNIKAVNPVVDLKINSLDLITEDVGKFLEIEITNNGNIPANELGVKVELSNGEVFTYPLEKRMPFDRTIHYKVPFDFELSTITNICAELSFDEIERDVYIYDNTNCITFNKGLGEIGFTKNPSQSDSYLQLTSPEAGIAHIIVFDSKGSKLLEQEFMLNKGLNNIPFKADDLSPGVYPVNVRFRGTSNSIKFIKQ